MLLCSQRLSTRGTVIGMNRAGGGRGTGCRLQQGNLGDTLPGDMYGEGQENECEYSKQTACLEVVDRKFNANGVAGECIFLLDHV